MALHRYRLVCLTLTQQKKISKYSKCIGLLVESLNLIRVYNKFKLSMLDKALKATKNVLAFLVKVWGFVSTHYFDV